MIRQEWIYGDFKVSLNQNMVEGINMMVIDGLTAKLFTSFKSVQQF